MKKFAVSTITFLLLFLYKTNSFGSGIELTNIGMRATALGGNFRSIAGDWSAMYWNPSGLVFNKGWSTGFSLEYITLNPVFKSGNSHYYNLNGGAGFRSFSATYEEKKSSEPLNFIVPSFGISYTQGNWAFGIGVWAPMGLGTKWDLLNTSGNASAGSTEVYNSSYPENEYENNMMVIDIHPTVSYKISDNLSIGAGISILYGEIEIKRPAFLQNPYLYDENLYNTLKSITEEEDIGTLDDMRHPPYDHLINDVEMGGSGMSFGGNFGIMYKPLKDLSIGASIQIFNDIEVSGDYSQTAYFGDNEEYDQLADKYDEEVFSKLHENGLIDDQSYLILTNFYSGERISIIDENATAEIPLPLKVGAGISYSGIDNFLIAADISFMEWSDWDVLYINDDNGNQISELVQNWENTWKIGIGAEYVSDFAVFRGGLSTENPAAVNETISPSIPEIGRRYNLDLGISVPVGTALISLNYQRVFIPDKKIDEWVYDEMNIGQNMAGFYSMDVNNIIIGIDYKF